MSIPKYKLTRFLVWPLIISMTWAAACSPQVGEPTDESSSAAGQEPSSAITETSTAEQTAISSMSTTEVTTSDNRELKRFNATFLQLFDTLTQVIGFAETEDEFRAEVALLKEDLTDYHELYDIFTTYEGVTNLKNVNDQAGQGPVKVDERIIDLLEYSIDLYEETDGRVNIAFGSVLALWHQAREVASYNPADAFLPDREALEEAAEHTSIEDVVIDRQNLTVELKDPEMSLDVGAIAKGYATEQIARLAEARGVKYMLISVGGNVRAIGGRGNDKEAWRVSIRNPFEEQQEEKPNLTILDIKQASLVTSGVYERYYTIDGERYHHIIDPTTLQPESHYMSVSIVTPDSGYADALSTAIFNMSLEEGQNLIEGMADTEAIWVLLDGTEIVSSGFRDLESD